MRTRLNKILAMFMVFAVIIPILWNMNIAVVKAAATPSLVQTKVEIVGAGETFQLKIKDKIAKSTYKWSSSNKKIATVTSKGLVTSVDKGLATIKCKVTYPSKKTKTLVCKVTVSIPATEINISNATLENGAHVLDVNESMDFDYTMLPENSSDKVYWSIGEGDTDCIRIDDAKTGKITAIKAGIVRLVATAAKSATKSSADNSFINDAVIIEVVGPSATVNDANITDSHTIVVKFDSPVNESTVLGTNNSLSSNIEVVQRKDTKGVLGDDPGTFTAALSTDKKTLTITTSKSMSGNYGIYITNNVKTADGLALEEYYKQLSYTDTGAPYIVQTTVDDSGLIATIQFNEAINFDKLKVSGATTVPAGVTADISTINTLNNVVNYIVSADKKSLRIDLTNIVTADKGKAFSVYITGITDTSGNVPSSVYVTAFIQTDNSIKPQARPLYILRTGYNTLTVTFDRAIKTAGYISVADGAMILGTVDLTNNKKVNYTITGVETTYTGIKTVKVGHYSGYNVAPTDTTASIMQPFSVNFTVETVRPVITNYVFNPETDILTLTFSEKINPLTTTGTFSSRFISITDDIRPNTNVSWTNVSHTEGNNIIKLKLGNLTLKGSYTFTISEAFVLDEFMNSNISKEITINNATGADTDLPAPFRIYQSTTNPDQIIVEFANKLDGPSATNVNNYKITGVALIKAEFEKNTPDTGATVILTMASESVVVSGSYPIVISGIKGYNNSYSEIISYTANVEIKENRRPYWSNNTFDSLSKNMIRLNFNEAIQGSMTVKVSLIVGSTAFEQAVSSTAVSGSSVNITLAATPASGSYLKVEILTNNITDLSGNPVKSMASQYFVMASY